MIRTQTFGSVGEFTYIGEAGRVAGQPYEVRRPAPDLGQHTAEVLRELGYTNDEIATLTQTAAI